MVECGLSVMAPLRPIWHRLVAVLLGAAAGGIVSLALWFVYSAVDHRPDRLTPADYEVARRRLDCDPKAIFRFDPVVSYAFKPRFVGQQYFYQPLPGGAPGRN
jgi:hypothetical protein